MGVRGLLGGGFISNMVTSIMKMCGRRDRRPTDVLSAAHSSSSSESSDSNSGSGGILQTTGPLRTL
eukprot:COSAG01_NODE_1910_length_8928_cov_33.079964_6_plen_66_part_00